MTVAKPTHDEVIRELSKEVAVLNERLNTVREDVKELKRAQEEASNKRWALLPPIVGAVVNVLLAAAVAYVVARK
jgi:predicted  nucleic acid-binding Zn-ribbon protein